MVSYVIGRVIAMIPSLAFLLLVVLALGKLTPGSTVDLMLQDSRANSVERAELEHRLGLDRSLPEIYVDYVGGLFRGNLGDSLWTGKDVTEFIGPELMVTLELAVLSLLVTLILGVPLGVICAQYRGGLFDNSIRIAVVLFVSVPSFVIGTAIIIFPSIYFQWTPPLFFTRFSDSPLDHFSQFLIPALLLGLATCAPVVRLTRSAMLDVLKEDYMRTARAKGLAEKVIIFRHALRNAFVPVITLLGLQFAGLLSGSVILENLFGLPGMGTRALDALQGRDYPVVQGVTLIVGLLVMALNLIVDLTYPLVDPRARGA